MELADTEWPDVAIDPRFPRGIARADWPRIAEAVAPGEVFIELVRGLAVRMSPVGRLHIRTNDRLVRLLNLQLDDSYQVSSNGELAAGDDSAPQPDVMVVRDEPANRDTPTEALLIVEVSVTSVRYDRTIKLAIYAEAGIPEYWIVDVKARVVEVYTQPDRASGRYAQVTVVRDGETLRPTLLPGVAIEVAQLPR